MGSIGIFQRILSLITYKEKQKREEFCIPEIKEEPDSHEEILRNGKAKGNTKVTAEDENDNEQCETLDSDKNEYSPTGRKFEQNSPISRNIDCNMTFIKKQFNFPSNIDIVIREFLISSKYRAFIAFMDGLVDKSMINNFIIRPLLNDEKTSKLKKLCSVEQMIYNTVEASQVKKVTESDIVISDILAGNTAIYVDQCDFYITCETKGYEKRAVDKPQVEGVVKGAQEAFNENLRTNISLVRRIIKNRDLTTEIVHVGDRNNNECAILYIRGLTNQSIVEEVKRRIKGIRTDFVQGDGFVEQLIEEHPFSIFPTILSTERPDRTASHILEGKVAIIAEGTPFADIVPITMYTLLHSPEDSSLRWQYGTVLRFVRLFALLVASFLPGLYVALTNYHREMIPTDLLIAIAKARENVPFPTIFEVLLMEASFELIREAGIRIPSIVGNTIGIIGALILGQAAVQANIVSPILIIVIAFTGLGNFAIPDYSLGLGIRIMRIVYIILGGTLGFFGISLGILASIAVLSNMKSFGMPILSIIAPKERESHDLILRLPLWMQELRPDNVNAADVRRQPKISRQWTREKAGSTKSKGSDQDDGEVQKGDDNDSGR